MNEKTLSCFAVFLTVCMGVGFVCLMYLLAILIIWFFSGQFFPLVDLVDPLFGNFYHRG